MMLRASLASLWAAQLSMGQVSPAPLPAKLERVSVRLDTFGVTLTLYDELLWKGTVNVNRAKPAVIHSSLTEAAGSPCRFIQFAENAKEVDFQISKWGGGANDPDRYHVVAAANVKNAPCAKTADSNDGIDRQTLRIRKGQTLALDGAHGLRVELLRKR